MLIMTSEGGEAKNNTNINFLLEEYGVMAHNGWNTSTPRNLFIISLL